MLEAFEALFGSMLEYAPALGFAALGAVLSERSGVVNIGVEGMMRVGAFFAAWAAVTLPTGLAVCVGVLAGALMAAVHGGLCIPLRANQIVSGMALNLIALAGVTFLLESFHGPMGTPSIQQLERLPLPWLEGIPVLRTLSGRAPTLYLCLLFAFGLHALLTMTPWGLRIRALGENPQAAANAGVNVSWVRFVCVVCSGALAGLGGACLSTSTLDRFEHHMPAGLGFMAVAAMVFGRWTMLGALGAAFFFSAASALRISLASSAPGAFDHIPQGVWMTLPYVLTLVALAAQRHRGGAPSALGQPYHPEAR